MVLFSTDSCDKTMDDDSGAGHEPPRRPIGVVRRPRALLFSTPSKVGDAGVRDGSARAGRTLRELCKTWSLMLGCLSSRAAMHMHRAAAS